MDAQNQLKKKVVRLMQQFGEKMGNNPPTAEQLEMYNLTLPQYQEGIALITAQLAEKEQARLQQVADEEEAKRKDVVDDDEAEKRRIADENILQEVAEKETLSAEEVVETTPKASKTGDKLQTSLHNLYAIQREKDEKDYSVQCYVQQAGAPEILLPSAQEIQQYTPSFHVTELQWLLDANSLSQFLADPLQSWLDYFLVARDDYLFLVHPNVQIPTQQHDYFPRQQPDPTTFIFPRLTFSAAQAEENMQRAIKNQFFEISTIGNRGRTPSKIPVPVL